MLGLTIGPSPRRYLQPIRSHDGWRWKTAQTWVAGSIELLARNERNLWHLYATCSAQVAEKASRCWSNRNRCLWRCCWFGFRLQRSVNGLFVQALTRFYQNWLQLVHQPIPRPNMWNVKFPRSHGSYRCDVEESYIASALNTTMWTW